MKKQKDDFFSQLAAERVQAFKELGLKPGNYVMHPRFGKGKVDQVNAKKKIYETYISKM